MVELLPFGDAAATAQREDELPGELGALAGRGLVETRHDRPPVDAFAVAAPEHGQGDELVVAQTGDHVGVAEREAQHVGDRQHERIAGGVAAAIVHVLQPAELDVQDEYLGAQPAGPLPRLVDGGKEAAAAQQAGELVAVGPVAGDLRELPMDGDVARDGETQPATGFVYPAKRHFDGQAMAVARHIRALEDEAAGLTQRQHPLLDRVPHLGRVQVDPGHGQQRAARVAPAPCRPSIDLDKPPRTVVVGQLVGADRIAASLEEGVVAPLAIGLAAVGGALPGAGVQPRGPGGGEGRAEQHDHEQPAGLCGEGGRQHELDDGCRRRAAHKGRHYPASHGLPCRGSAREKALRGRSLRYEVKSTEALRA